MGNDRGVWLRGAKLLPNARVLGGKFRVQHDGERNIELLEQPADARDSPVDRVLAKCLVHEVRTPAREVRTQHRALPEAELLDEQSEADGDLFADGPGGDMDRLARKRRDPIGTVLSRDRGGKVNREQRRCRAAEK